MLIKGSFEVPATVDGQMRIGQGAPKAIAVATNELGAGARVNVFKLAEASGERLLQEARPARRLIVRFSLADEGDDEPRQETVRFDLNGITAADRLSCV